MVKKQQKRASKTRAKSKKQAKIQAVLPLITKTITSTEGGCADSLTLSLQIEKDKITKLLIKPERSCCSEVKKLSTELPEQVIGKHLSDVYRIKEDTLDAKAMPHHSTTLLIHALRQAMLEYESQKANTALREAVAILQEYDKDLPERTLETDYEY